MGPQVLHECGGMLELFCTMVAGVVEALHRQLTHQHMVFESRHASSREITLGVSTPKHTCHDQLGKIKFLPSDRYRTSGVLVECMQTFNKITRDTGNKIKIKVHVVHLRYGTSRRVTLYLQSGFSM